MVSLIIPVYLRDESYQKYLDLCLESIQNLDYPKHELETIVVSSGPVMPKLDWHTVHKLKHIYEPERMHYAKAINKGVANSNGETLFLLSDDLILTKRCLSSMAQIIEANDNLILGPISNCEYGRRFIGPIGLIKDNKVVDLSKIEYRFEDLIGMKTDLMNAKSFFPQSLVFQEWLCFFSVMMRRSTWNVVGGLDERFLSGQEDLDFCMRAKRTHPKPIICAMDMGAVVWHFSGVTAEHSIDQQMRSDNIKRFSDKWTPKP